MLKLIIRNPKLSEKSKQYKNVATDVIKDDDDDDDM